MRLGFIGTGNITVAVVNGICGSKIAFKKILVFQYLENIFQQFSSFNVIVSGGYKTLLGYWKMVISSYLSDEWNIIIDFMKDWSIIFKKENSGNSTITVIGQNLQYHLETS